MKNSTTVSVQEFANWVDNNYIEDDTEMTTDDFLAIDYWVEEFIKTLK